MTTNTILTNRSSELAELLKKKLKCYVSVGWMKDPDAGPLYMVYVDQHALVDTKEIPSGWYGLPVVSQDVLPPGIPDIDAIPTNLLP